MLNIENVVFRYIFVLAENGLYHEVVFVVRWSQSEIPMYMVMVLTNILLIRHLE